MGAIAEPEAYLATAADAMTEREMELAVAEIAANPTPVIWCLAVVEKSG